MSVLASSFVIALMTNLVAYHPLWGGVQTIILVIGYILCVAWLGAIATHLHSDSPVSYQYPAASSTLSTS